MICKNSGLKILGLSGGACPPATGLKFFFFLMNTKNKFYNFYFFFSVEIYASECTVSNKRNLPTQNCDGIRDISEKEYFWGKSSETG